MMAIGRWIPFGQPQPSAASPVVVAAQPPVISAADAKQFGLENFGNTCYANSVLQALYFCGPFRELLAQYPDPSAPDTPPSSPPPAPVPVATAPNNATTVRRKPERKPSVSEPSPSQSSALSTGPPQQTAHTAPPPIPPQPPTLLSALRSLFVHISHHPAEKGTVAPRAFIEKLKELNELFRGSMHQDAHEFLNFLLNKIVEEMDDDRRRTGSGSAIGGSLYGEDLSASIATMSSTAAPPTTISAANSHSHGIPHQTLVHRLFEGVLTSETRCLTCETVSSRDESFLDLSIDIEQNSSVTACLRQFSASEMLCQKNKFFCDSCCDLQEAEKRMKIKKLPNILALHLKRFKYQEDVGKYIKLAYRVAFPMELRLFNTVDDAENPDRLYELFAIVVHIGNGPHHGHYVTIIKARGTWLLFDDDSVDTIKESDIPKYYGESTNGSAYVLYYQAVDLDMAALGLRPREAAPSPTDIGSAPTVKPIDVATVMTTTEYSERDSSSPALPPGLTEEQDSSDNSDSPLPATPASQPVPLSSSQTPKPSTPSPPKLSISPPASTQTASGPTTPVQASVTSATHSALGGLFNTLRQTPSMRGRNNGRGSEQRKSMLDPASPPVPPLSSSSKIRRPATAQSSASVGESSHTGYDTFSEPASPSGFNAAEGNGSKKDKTPEKKASIRFIKRSLGSARAVSSSTPPIPQSQPMQATTSVPPSPVQPRSMYPEHKKSQPELTPKGKGGKSTVASSAFARLPRRPSTAGATVGSSSWSRPSSAAMPPLPTLPGSPNLQQGPDADVNGASGETTDPISLPNSAPEGRGLRGTPIPQRPSTASSATHAASSLGFSTSYSTSSTTSAHIGESPVPSSPTVKKRASRKLSFTAPMFGFGRRDRQKDKEAQPPPPSSYPSHR